MTSVGFCENVIFARNASLAKLSIDSLETTVTGSWDRRGLFDIEGASPHFRSITVETRISTRDAIERVVEVARQTHRRCPVHATPSRATEMIFKLVVNGQNVPL
ncbi:OsmC family protein [Candidatus Bathyarchaeota archaeon]|nr:MAG: OsmC family protein [Candidatus Bathyarchaeota archaeon]TMI75219.1 MAG: OsmC family protein [Candidatus Bathyarchaeota archaeon]